MAELKKTKINDMFAKGGPPWIPMGPTRAATQAFEDVAELRNALFCARR
jgi:hypothetical protein